MISAPFRSAFPVLAHRSVLISAGLIAFIFAAVFAIKRQRRIAEGTCILGVTIISIGCLAPPVIVKLALYALMATFVSVPICGLALHIRD